VTPYRSFHLNVEHLACHRGGRRVFESVNLALAPGEWLELRGPNGSGKSSLLRLLAGLGMPEAGTISLGAEERAQACHFIAHGDAFKTALTVLENLSFWAQFLGGDDVDGALTSFNMTALADVPTAFLSEGQRRRLSLSRLKLVDRPLWLLDEPSVGLDEASLAQLRRVIADHLSRGGVMVISTHVDLGLPKNKVLTLDGAA
jgi:heme exporter protein A